MTVTLQTVDQIPLGTLIQGEGEPVVLLHGWGANLETMRHAATRLAQQGYQTHALDLPGFGTSAPPPETWDVPRYGELVRAYLDTHQLNRVRLIGHSFGGRISIYLGATYPARIHQIVLVDSAGVKLPPALKWRLYYLSRRIIFNVLKIPGLRGFEPGVRQRFRQKFGSSDYLQAGVLTETFKQVVNQDLVPFAKKIQAPTLLIWGDQDMDTPLAEAKVLEKAIPDAGLVVLEGAGHYSYLDRPADFLRIVTTFFRSG